MDAEIQRSLGRIEGHLEGIVGDIGELRTEQKETTARVTDLEGWKKQATGLAGMVAFVVSMLVTFITTGFHIGR